MPLSLNTKIAVITGFDPLFELIKNELQEIGFTSVQSETSGDEVITKIKDEVYDLLICCYNLVPYNGLQLLKYLRENQKTKTFPVFFVLDEAKSDLINQLNSFGMNGYIVKPFPAFVLKENLEKTFGPIQK